jgi:Uma2 family endonuclease
MTLAEPIHFRPKSNGRAVVRLPKVETSDDVRRLQDLAVELDGRPVPGVRMTEKQFDEWCDEDVRAEWVNGEVILLSPSNLRHADLNHWLGSLVRAVAEDNDAGKVYVVQVQARLPSIRQRRDPDILFVSRARRNILKETYVDGPPDLVMEIVSPDSQSRDWRDKYKAYERSGVREYWIIDPSSQRVEAYARRRQEKFARIRERDGLIRSKVLRKFFVRPQWLWQSPLLKLPAALRELGVRG